MENEVTELDRRLTDAEQKEENKRNWINQIYLKQLQGEPLTMKDHSFWLSTIVNETNEEHIKRIKAQHYFLQKFLSEKQDELDPEVYIKLMEGMANLELILFRNIKQGQKDDAITRKADVDTLNRYAKIAQKNNIDLTGDTATRMKEALRKREESLGPKIIDVKDKDDS